jgi:hypothetical protein
MVHTSFNYSSIDLASEIRAEHHQIFVKLSTEIFNMGDKYYRITSDGKIQVVLTADNCDIGEYEDRGTSDTNFKVHIRCNSVKTIQLYLYSN